MAKTVKLAGLIVANLPIPDGETQWHTDFFNESGSNQITGSLGNTDVVDSKPTFGFPHDGLGPISASFDSWNDIPSSWSTVSASITGSLITEICSKVPISESLLDEIYLLQIQDTEGTAVEGYGNYYKYRMFVDGVNIENMYIPVTSADTGSYASGSAGIPRWDG